MPATAGRWRNPGLKNVNNPAAFCHRGALNFFVIKLTIGIMYTNLTAVKFILRLI
jgi:hypothetical protein